MYYDGHASAQECTLILTEGDSAKALAVAGLAVLGRDKYGAFALAAHQNQTAAHQVGACGSLRSFRFEGSC